MRPDLCDSLNITVGDTHATFRKLKLGTLPGATLVSCISKLSRSNSAHGYDFWASEFCVFKCVQNNVPSKERQQHYGVITWGRTW